MSEALIQTDGLCKDYPTARDPLSALRDVSLSIGRSEFVAIMGPSGSGKSTLLNLLGCIDRPTAGSYALGGREVSKLSDDALAAIRCSEIGLVFQNFNLLPRTSAVENVELPLLYQQVAPRERRRRALELLDELGLGDRSHHHPSELSGGERQRVAIARALVHQPSVILADEPTGSLDSRTSIEIMDLFQDLNRRGAAIILVTHDPEVARHARRVIAFRDGCVVGDTPVGRPNHTMARASDLNDQEAERNSMRSGDSP